MSMISLTKMEIKMLRRKRASSFNMLYDHRWDLPTKPKKFNLTLYVLQKILHTNLCNSVANQDAFMQVSEQLNTLIKYYNMWYG